jgi:hypothetical protein
MARWMKNDWDGTCGVFIPEGVVVGKWLRFIHLPMKMEPIEGSETSDIRTNTPGNYPKENILQYKYSFI